MSSRSDQFDLFDAISNLAPGTRIKIPGGDNKGEWLKLGDESRHTMYVWANLKDGRVVSWSQLCDLVWPFEIVL